MDGLVAEAEEVVRGKGRADMLVDGYDGDAVVGTGFHGDERDVRGKVREGVDGAGQRGDDQDAFGALSLQTLDG